MQYNLACPAPFCIHEGAGHEITIKHEHDYNYFYQILETPQHENLNTGIERRVAMDGYLQGGNLNILSPNSHLPSKHH